MNVNIAIAISIMYCFSQYVSVDVMSSINLRMEKHNVKDN